MITLKLTEQQIEIVTKALAVQPYNIVATTIAAIQIQLEQADTKASTEPVAERRLKGV